MIGILVGGLIAFLLLKWYFNSVNKMRAVRLVHPGEANGKVGDFSKFRVQIKFNKFVLLR